MHAIKDFYRSGLDPNPDPKMALITMAAKHFIVRTSQAHSYLPERDLADRSIDRLNRL
jgi:hypothetical protein